MARIGMAGAQAMLVLGMTASIAAQSAAGNFNLDKSVEAPGTVLKSGVYTVSVVDSLTDRTVLRLDSENGKRHLLLLGVRNNALSGTPGQPVFWDSKTKGKHALRGFVLADGRSVEVVYPKADAVGLASANHQSVVAVDTASEGRPELDKLSQRDMQLVSLWLLTPTRVGADAKQNGLEAKRYEPSAANQTAQATQPQSALSTGNATAAYAPSRSVSAARSSAPVQTARAEAPAAVKPQTTTGRHVSRLPQTGSELPLLYLVSTTALAGAAVSFARRQRRTVA